MPLDGRTTAALWTEYLSADQALRAATTGAAAQPHLARLLKMEAELDFGDEAGQPEAVLHLDQRVGVLLPVRLETRFRKSGANWILRLRIVPEPVAFDPRPRPAPGQTRTADAERRALQTFWTSVGGDLADADAPRAFGVLADLVGAARAAWLVGHVPLSITAAGAVVDPIPAPAPPLATLPPRLGIWLARGGGAPVLVKTLDVKAAEIADQSTIERLAATGVQFNGFWWNDFATAEGLGLACEIGLGPSAQIDRLIVVGLGSVAASAVFGAHAEAGQLGVLAPGTATNAVDGGPTVPLELDADSWLALVRRVGTTQAGTRQLATYLTGDPAALPALPGGDVDGRTTPQRAASLLIPGILGRALHDQWLLGVDGQAAARWATRWLLPGGPCPVVRVGDVPYGVLPVAARESRWQAASDEPAVDTAILRRTEQAAVIGAQVAHGRGTAAGADAAAILGLVTRTPVTSRWLARPALPLPLVALAVGGTVDIVMEFENAAQQAVASGFAPAVPVVGVGDAVVLPPERVRRDALPLGVLADLAFAPWSGGDDMRDRHKQTYRGDRLIEMLAERRREGRRHLVECLIDASMVLTHARLTAVLAGGDGTVNLVDADELQQRVAPAVTPPDRDAAAASGPLGAEIARAWEDARTAFDELMRKRHDVREVVDAAYGLLDAASHRGDQWATGVADRRLRRLAARGVPFVVGAYGWVDAPAPAGDPLDLRPGPGPTRGGLVHAPGSAHAATAALLRDRAVNAPGGLWDIALDSTRIRAALRLARYVREGITLAEALGREVERILATPERVDAVRKAFPARPETAGRQVCHGERVIAAAKGNADLPLLTGGVVAASPAEVDEIARLTDGVEAWADLLVTDSTFALVGGQGRLAAASLDAIAGLAVPPEMRAVRTPRRGAAVSTTLLGVLPAAAPSAGSGPNGVASPELAAEIVRRFGGAAAWTWVRDEPGGAVAVSLAGLGLEPIDVLALGDRTLDALAGHGRPLRSSGGAERVAAARRLAKALTGAGPVPDGWPGLPAARAAQVAARAATDLAALSAVVEGDPGSAPLVIAARWGTPIVAADLAPGEAGVAAREVLIAGARAELAARLSRDDASAPAATRIANLLGTGIALPATVATPAALGLAGALRRADLDAAWLEPMAAVRPEAAVIEAYQLAPGVAAPLSGWTLGLAPWAAPAPGAGGTTIAYGPAGTLSAAAIAVWPLAAWGEVVPSREHTTFAAFGFNAPDSRAPQAVLLAVPPDLARPLDDDDLVAAIDWVRTLAHARVVAPEALRRHGVAAEIAPLTLLHAAGILRAGPGDTGPFGGLAGAFMAYERIEPDPWPDVAAAVAAPVADPLWLLGRQWQVGEHRGEDASSPVELRCDTSTAPLTSLDRHIGRPGAPSAPIDPAIVPAEALIEADPASWWTMGRRVRLGAAAAGRLDALGIDDAQRQALRFPPLSPPYEAHGGALDGRAVYHAGLFAGDAIWGEVPTTPPDHWRSDRLDYASVFAAGGGRLTIDGHDGGDVDWWSCDAATPPAAAAAPVTRSVVPGRLRYPGAPLPRYWQIEDAGRDPSAFPPDAPRWATTLWTDLVSSASGDWFSAPVPSGGPGIGSIVTLHGARVRDSFDEWWGLAFPRVKGEPGPDPEWSIYRTTGLPAGALVLWPTALAPLTAAPWEEALLGVDEDADLCWAVETRIDGVAHDRGWSDAPPATPAASYRLEPTWGAPPHGHPYRIEARPGGRRFVQGLVADLSGPVPRLRPGPGTMLLRNRVSGPPGHEILPGAVPSVGIRLVRRFRLARGVDGRPVLWLQTERLPLQTGPVSHLRFDVLLPEAGASRA